jgi:hypothetical protein
MNDWQEKLIKSTHRLQDPELWQQNGWQLAVLNAQRDNLWFAPEATNYALDSLRTKFFSENKLRQWIEGYTFNNEQSRRVGLICAGNLPMVGFHDILSVLIAGHTAVIKLSHKDKHLIPFVLDQLAGDDKELRSRIEIVERLKDFDAVIATGSDNSQRYFKYYFGQKPHVFRNNRTSVAIINGDETDEELKGLADDMLLFFGLGCRNVSKVFLPKDFDLDRIFNATLPYTGHMLHSKYKNNYQYQLALLFLNKDSFLTNDLIIAKESQQLQAAISVMHYEYYDDLESVQDYLAANAQAIQCVFAREPVENIETIAFGRGQQPELWDYADHINTLDFLQKL